MNDLPMLLRLRAMFKPPRIDQGQELVDKLGVRWPSMPFDYDMVFIFKSLPKWSKAMHPETRAILVDRGGRLIEDYNGRPARDH